MDEQTFAEIAIAIVVFCDVFLLALTAKLANWSDQLLGVHQLEV